VEKPKKKKWSKGKQREKANNLVIFDKETYAKFEKEIPTAKLITPSTVSERLKVNGSLARRAINLLLEKGSVKLVAKHHRALIYTRATAAVETKPAEGTAKPSAKQGAKKGNKKEDKEEADSEVTEIKENVAKKDPKKK